MRMTGSVNGIYLFWVEFMGAYPIDNRIILLWIEFKVGLEVLIELFYLQ